MNKDTMYDRCAVCTRWTKQAVSTLNPDIDGTGDVDDGGPSVHACGVPAIMEGQALRVALLQVATSTRACLEVVGGSFRNPTDFTTTSVPAKFLITL